MFSIIHHFGVRMFITICGGIVLFLSSTLLYADRGAIFEITNKTGGNITYNIYDVKKVKFHDNNQMRGSINDGRAKHMTVHVDDCDIFGGRCDGEFAISIQRAGGHPFKMLIGFYKKSTGRYTSESHSARLISCHMDSGLTIYAYNKGLITRDWYKIELEILAANPHDLVVCKSNLPIN